MLDTPHRDQGLIIRRRGILVKSATLFENARSTHSRAPQQSARQEQRIEAREAEEFSGPPADEGLADGFGDAVGVEQQQIVAAASWSPRPAR